MPDTDRELELVEKWDGWWVHDTAYDEWIAGPHDSKEAARIARDHEIDRRIEAAAELAAVGDRDFSPPYEP